MSVLSVPTDDMGRPLLDRGSRLITDRVTFGETLTAYRLPIDTKEYAAVVVSGTLVLRGVTHGSVISLNNAAVVNNGDGTVTVAATAHGLTDGDTFVIPPGQSTNYVGTHTILAAGDANSLVFTHAYVAETIASGAYCFGYRDVQYEAGEHFGDPIVKIDPTDTDLAGNICGLQPLFYARALSGTCVVDVRAWG